MSKIFITLSLIVLLIVPSSATEWQKLGVGKIIGLHLYDDGRAIVVMLRDGRRIYASIIDVLLTDKDGIVETLKAEPLGLDTHITAAQAFACGQYTQVFITLDSGNSQRAVFELPAEWYVPCERQDYKLFIPTMLQCWPCTIGSN